MNKLEYFFQAAADFLWKDWMLVMLLAPEVRMLVKEFTAPENDYMNQS